MVDAVVTYAAIQAASATVSAAISAYLNAPLRPNFHADNGQETLYDDENWARVLDIQEILRLVRPFISASQNLDVGPIIAQTTTNTGPRDRGRRLGESSEDGPPPYDRVVLPADPQAFLKEKSYLIVNTTQRLIETLNVASGGPSGSGPRMWNLSISASVEHSLQVLALYRKTTRMMANSPPGSFLAEVLAAMSLYDTELLKTVEGLFRSVRLDGQEHQDHSPHYQLRLPAAKRYLEVGYVDRIPTTEIPFWPPLSPLARMAMSAANGWALYAGYAVYKYATRVDVQTASTITKEGTCASEIRLVPVSGHVQSDQHDDKAASGDVRFGMQVHVVATVSGRGLEASNDPRSLAAVRIVHHDDRFRSASMGREICVRDRFLLKEESTGKLLSRKRIGDDDWKVGFGLSDDSLWTVTLPL